MALLGVGQEMPKTGWLKTTRFGFPNPNLSETSFLRRNCFIPKKEMVGPEGPTVITTFFSVIPIIYIQKIFFGETKNGRTGKEKASNI
jgi:hypothetical protein